MLTALVQAVSIRVTRTTQYSQLTFAFVLGSPEKLCVLVIVTRDLAGDSARGELLSQGSEPPESQVRRRSETYLAETGLWCCPVRLTRSQHTVGAVVCPFGAQTAA